MSLKNSFEKLLHSMKLRIYHTGSFFSRLVEIMYAKVQNFWKQMYEKLKWYLSVLEVPVLDQTNKCEVSLRVWMCKETDIVLYPNFCDNRYLFSYYGDNIYLLYMYLELWKTFWQLKILQTWLIYKTSFIEHLIQYSYLISWAFLKILFM